MVNKKAEPEVVSRDVLYQLGKLIEPEDYRALYYFSCLTGPRITEALKVDRQDMRWEYSPKNEKNVFLVTLQTEKRADKLNRTIPLQVFPDSAEEEMFKQVFRWWECCGDGRVFPLDRSIVWRKWKKYITLEDITAQLGRPLREMWNSQVRDATELRFYPHYLRACRVTHLWRGPYRGHADKIQKYFGWRNILMLDRYLKTDWEALVYA